MKGEAEKLHDSLYQPIAHDSAALYVTGAAQFTDDIAFPEDGLHIALGLSAVAHAKLVSLDLTDVLAADGVVCIAQRILREKMMPALFLAMILSLQKIWSAITGNLFLRLRHILPNRHVWLH